MATLLASRRELVALGALTVVHDTVVRHQDGRSWTVEVKQQEVAGIVASCGDAEKTGKVWVVEKISGA